MNGYIGSALNDDLSMVSKDGYYFTRGEMDEIYEAEHFCPAGRGGQRSVPVRQRLLCHHAAGAGGWVCHAEQLHPAEVLPGAQMGLLEESRAEACRVVLNEYGQKASIWSPWVTAAL